MYLIHSLETLNITSMIILASNSWLRKTILDRKIIDKTSLYNYYFSWGINLIEGAIALGYGSLYNHSYKPNAKYIKYLDKKIIKFLAHTEIKKGDEIKVNYNEDPDNLEPLWFTANP